MGETVGTLVTPSTVHAAIATLDLQGSFSFEFRAFLQSIAHHLDA